MIGQQPPFVELEDDWSDREVYAVAGGPSLMGHRLSGLRDRGWVVGANKVAMATEVDVVVSLDQFFVRNFRDELCSLVSRGVQAIFALPTSENQHRPVPGARYVIRDRNRGIVWRRDRINGANSGYGAMALAASLGAKRIHLLGYDMDHRGVTHWHGGYPWKNANNGGCIRRWAADFQLAAQHLRDAGVHATLYHGEFTNPAMLDYFHDCRPVADLLGERE